MRLLRVYTRKRGEHPDLNDPVIVRRGGTIEDVVRSCLLVTYRLSTLT